LTGFLATAPAEFVRQRDEVIAQLDPFDAVRSISPRPLLIVHGTEDRWVPAEQARRLHAQARQPCRYVEIDGANHDFAWHRGRLREVVAGWLAEPKVGGGAGGRTGTGPGTPGGNRRRGCHRRWLGGALPAHGPRCRGVRSRPAGGGRPAPAAGRGLAGHRAVRPAARG